MATTKIDRAFRETVKELEEEYKRDTKRYSGIHYLLKQNYNMATNIQSAVKRTMDILMDENNRDSMISK